MLNTDLQKKTESRSKKTEPIEPTYKKNNPGATQKNFFFKKRKGSLGEY